jgi:hypothetical protein
MAIDPIPQLLPPPDPETVVTGASLAYGGGAPSTLNDIRIFRLERGAPYLRAGSPLAVQGRFGQKVYGRINNLVINSSGVIDPSAGGLAAKGSTPRCVSQPNFTFTAFSPTSLEIAWTPQALRRADGTYTQVTSVPTMASAPTINYAKGRIQIDGLTAATAYNFYPYWSEAAQKIGWYLDRTLGTGTPPIAFTSSAIIAAIGTQGALGNINLQVISFTMPASGSSSGASGGFTNDGTGNGATGGGGRKTNLL